MKPDLSELVARLRDAWDDEVEAEAWAQRILGAGPDGIGALAGVLRESSGSHPKLAVGILNAIRTSANPLGRQVLARLIDDRALTEEDRAYLLSILGALEPADAEHAQRLVRSLQSTRDASARAEILREIAKLHVSDAKVPLERLSRRTGNNRLDYGRDPEQAVAAERVRFVLWGLEGRDEELQMAAFGLDSHPYRRVAALEILCLSLGSECGPIIRRAIQDPDPNFRGIAVGLVGELKLIGLSDVVETSLQDSNAWVVQQAAYSLRDLSSSPEFSADLDRVHALHRALLATLRAREKSDDRTDRQIIVPVLRKVSTLLESLLAT